MRMVITGGAGFIGSNLARAMLADGHVVTLYDNLSRPGSTRNMHWLREQFGARVELTLGDVRNTTLLAEVMRGADVVIHLAGQVAVTTSVQNPRDDFEINALGTFNVLEAARSQSTPPIVLYASTNKVYGGMEDVPLVEEATRYRYRDMAGIPETQPLDFHSPYGCSKGTGDQYVHDYSRIYGMRTVVFRQSCLAASQEVVTPFGLKPISLLRSGDLVHSGWGWTRVRRVWKTGVKPVRRLTTMNGLNVTITEDHRVVRPHGLFTNRDFAYGDFLAVLPEALHMPQWEEVQDQVLNAEAYMAAVKAKTTDRRCLNEAAQLADRLLPLRGEPLLAVAELVGRLFGDGHLGVQQRQSREQPSYSVQHFGSEDELREVSTWLNWLGLPVSGIVRSNSISELPNGHVVKGQSCRIQQQSISVFTLFELLDIPVGDKVRTEYSLPTWVAQGHSLVKRAFLRGFFGAELCKVNADSYLAPSFAQSKDVEFLESGRAWIEQLRDLIREFGIETSCFEAEAVEYKRGTTVQTTVRLLGGRDTVPKLAAIGYGFSAMRNERLNALLRWHWSHTTPERFEQTYQLYRADGLLFWDSLASFEPLGEMDVYDLEVEDDRHLFMAGGIQVSNCIYGPRQFGVEDQGWLAHFVIATQLGRPISIYGNGKQVRDMLYIDDLVRAYKLAVERIDQVSGQVFNIGGGPANVLSIWAEVGELLEELAGHDIAVMYGEWRPGDQPVCIMDITKAERELGWKPAMGVRDGVGQLWNWVRDNRALFEGGE